MPRGGCTGGKEWSGAAVSETCLVAGQGPHAAMHIETGAVQLERCWAGQGRFRAVHPSAAHQAEQARLRPALPQGAAEAVVVEVDDTQARPLAGLGVGQRAAAGSKQVESRHSSEASCGLRQACGRAGETGRAGLGVGQREAAAGHGLKQSTAGGESGGACCANNRSAPGELPVKPPAVACLSFQL